MSHQAQHRVIVIGSGPVGVGAAESILEIMPSGRVTLYGDEPDLPYNRVRLSSYVAGDANRQSLQLGDLNHHRRRLQTRFGCRVTGIDPQRKTVRDAQGREVRYDSLVLATGSRPHIPEIPGICKEGVYTFRDLHDAHQLMRRRETAKNIVIIGGGLLGLEAAKAMVRPTNSVVVIEHNAHLMFNQLDSEAGRLLEDSVVSLGIRVMTAERIVEVEGKRFVTSLKLGSGLSLVCDTLIIAAGIRANIDLALGCGLAVNRGICVDDELRTSNKDIYAVGECAEHNGVVYGLVTPGIEQANVLAHVLASRATSYRGSTSATHLKVVGVPVFSMGRVGATAGLRTSKEYSFVNAGGVYRKIVLHRDRIVGAIALGSWPDLGKVQEALSRRRRIWPWQLRRFFRTGTLWPEESRPSARWHIDAQGSAIG